MTERALTPEDRDKIRHLLVTLDPDNVRLAISLIEETASDDDVDSILSEDMILTLIASGNPEIFVRTGHLAIGVEAVWQRFSDRATEFWAMPEGYHFGQLMNLSDAAAESLEGRGGGLDLDGLTSLSDAAACSIGSIADGWYYDQIPEDELWENPGILSLNGLTSLSDAAAESLGEYRGRGLELNGLTSVSDAAAESLSKCKGGWCLSLNGLLSLSDAAAESLSKHEGGNLNLNGLTSLSDAAAESLRRHEGKLYLHLDNLPASATEILRQHPSFQDDDDDDE